MPSPMNAKEKQLIEAAEAGDLTAMAKLLPAKPHLYDSSGVALCAAGQNGHLKIVRYLLNRDVRSDWVLYKAAEAGQTKVVRLLLDRGVREKIDQALIIAAAAGQVETLSLLLDQSANINDSADSALCCAAREGHLKTVELLLGRGANVRANDNEALRNAARCGNTKIVRLLLEHGAYIHARSEGALSCAILYGHLSVVRLLLRKGADLHACGDEALRDAFWCSNDKVTALVTGLTLGRRLKSCTSSAEIETSIRQLIDKVAENPANFGGGLLPEHLPRAIKHIEEQGFVFFHAARRREIGAPIKARPPANPRPL